jgi:translocation and assembly module TamB
LAAEASECWPNFWRAVLMAPIESKRPRKGRVVGRKIWFGLKVATGVVFALTTAGAVVLHLDLPITRRLVARVTNRLLLPVFRGRLTIEHLGRLGLDGIDGTRVRIFDPAGQCVVVAEGVHARILTIKLIRGLLASPMAVDVEIPEATIDHVDLLFDTDQAGVPLLATALTPVLGHETPARKGPLGVLVVIAHATVRHAWVHGLPSWGPQVDLDLTDVDGKVVATPNGVKVDVHHASVGARGLPLGGNGSGDVHGRVLVPSEQGNVVGIEGTLDGTFAGVEHTAHLSLDGNLVSADLELKEVDPDKVRSFVPGYPLRDIVSAHFGARGILPHLDVEMRAKGRGGGSIFGTGSTVLAEKKTAKLHATFANVDLQALAPGLPPSRLGGDIDAALALDAESNLTGEVTVVSKGGTLSSQALPAAEVRGTFAHGARFGTRGEATLTFRDPGVTGRATLRLVPKGSSYELGFDASAQAPQLDAVKRFRLTTQGSARASLHGTLALDTFMLSADLEAQASDLAQPGLGPPEPQVKSATAKVHASGSIFLPVIDAKIHADSLLVGRLHSDVADITVKGVVTAPHVHAILAGGDVPNVDGDADVTFGRITLLRRLRIGLSRDNDAVELRAEQIRIAGDGVSGDTVAIDGLGGPVQGRFRVMPQTVEINAQSERIDLALLARLLGVPEWCKHGRLSFDAAATIHPGVAEGRARIDVTEGSFGAVNGVSAHAELALNDQHLGGHIHADLGDIGTADLVGENLQMAKAGGASLRSWQRIWGAVELNAALDLARLEAALPKDSLPFGAMQGRLEVAGKFKRISMRDDNPQLALSIRTSQLEIFGKAAPAPLPSSSASPVPESPVGGGLRERERTLGRAAAVLPRWRLEGVDLGLDARIDGETGFAEFAGRVTDAKGPLLSLDMKSGAMPYAALVADPKSARELLARVPFEGHLLIPKRELATFPPALNVAQAEGLLEADLTVKGTPADPSLDLRAALTQAGSSSVRVALPVDLQLASHYGQGHTQATLTAQSPKSGEILRAEAQAEGRLSELFARGEEAPWHAEGHAHMAGFPLGAVGFLEDRQVHGELSGDVAWKGLHQDASLTLDLAVDRMQIGEVRYKAAALRATLDGHTLDATAHLDHTDGFADAHVRAGMLWGAALWPSLDAGQPVDASLTTKQLRAETLLPFANETLAELEGRIDGKAHLSFDPKEGKPRLDGRVTLEHGKFELSSAFGEFHDARATLVLAPDGVATLENATAHGVTGEVEIAASARMSGLSLGAARASLQIPSKQPIPVTVEGTALGTIDGVIRVTEDPTPDGHGMKIGVDIPKLHVHLPQSGSRNVQSLGEIDDARIEAQHGGELVDIALGPAGEPKVRAANAKRIEITTHLGDDVEVRRGTDLKVGLAGGPTITITDTVHMGGQLRLERGGTLDVQGKSFEIETGTVTFVGDDPANPQVVVTAGWNAPEGTRIYADYIGPLKTGKVTFRSEPALAQSDIIALLLFGTAEGTSAVAQNNAGNNTANSTASSAAGLAGGQAAQPINHALDQFGIHAVSAKVDTSLASNPKPEVELQVAKDISVQLAYVLGTPPPGVNPDTTLLTLNWRFLKNWSLGTTVGNAGTSIVDMLWQRRY